MGLDLYLEPNDSGLITETNKFSITFDGRIGGAQDKVLYIRNDDSNKWYNSISLQVIDSSTSDRTDNTVDGWFWKLLQKDVPPIDHDWVNVSPGNTLSISESLTDIATFLTVWVRVQIPRGQDIQTITNISFRLQAQENLNAS